MVTGTVRNLSLAFRVPAYRWMWASSFFGANGFMSVMLAQGWLILELTNSPFMVGLAPGLGGAANMVFSPIGGVLADRLNRRMVLIASQATTALITLALGLLTVAHLVEVWHILLASVFQGFYRGLQGPARSSLMYDVVGREAVMNAMAGQFLAFHGASTLGPTAAGFLMAAFGPGLVFLIVSGLLFVSALALLPLPHFPRPRIASRSIWQDLREGVRFALHDRSVRTVLGVILFTEGLGFSARSMFPVVARDLLNAGPAVLGLLSTLWGVGGIVGAVTLSSLGDIRPKGWVFIGAACGFGACLLAFSFSRNVPLSLALLLLTGCFGTTYDTMATTLLQTLSPDAFRGRILGLYSLLISGVSLGALAMGTVANIWNVTAAIAGGGTAVTLNALRVVPSARFLGERASAKAPAVDAGEHHPETSPSAKR
ncbi:MAG: MFS transporter [Chloroflexi bacterium]|nr:MFS transporter [Chloroflexota bacterium]